MVQSFIQRAIPAAAAALTLVSALAITAGVNSGSGAPVRKPADGKIAAGPTTVTSAASAGPLSTGTLSAGPLSTGTLSTGTVLTEMSSRSGIFVDIAGATPIPVYRLKPEEAMAVCEAVIQYRSRPSRRQPNEDGGYFISIDDRDPDAAFWKQFAGRRPSVRPGSQYRKGKCDLLFQIADCEPGKARVSCESWQEDVSWVYYVVYANGVWTVTSAFGFVLCG